ncbi:hypothetical protein ACP70R_003936 [Stipagrostis hirtigluma subsp. patula]
MPPELGEAVVLAPAVAPSSSTPFLRWVKAMEPIDKAFAMMYIWFVLILLQWILGLRRRRSGHWSVQRGAMAAYYLPSPLALYAAGTIYYPNSDSSEWLLCVTMIMLSACDNGITTAYTLRDGPVPRWRPILWLLYLVWQHGDYICGRRKLGQSDILYFVCIFIALLLILLNKPALRRFDSETIPFARYMREELRSSSPFFDGNANSLYNGCKYPFAQINGQWVTIKDMLQCDTLQRQFTVGHRVIWLSYSLCRLLARRYFHLGCAEEGNTQVREFAFTELLRDYKRAFDIVEMQLVFLHDFLFTRYDTISNYRLSPARRAISNVIGSTVISFGITTAALLPFSIKWYARFACVVALAGLILSPVQGFIYRNFGFTGLVTGEISIPGPVSILYDTIDLPTHWKPIKNVFRYYPTAKVFSARIERHIRHNQGSLWKDKMGQYSLIEDYDRRSLKKAFITWIKKYILSQVSPRFMKYHPIEEKEVSVPDSVRRLVARTLRGINGPPTNGTRSLSMNSLADDLSWTCRQESHTHTILIWHIATWYCDMFAPEVTRRPSSHEVATTLSGYCAYLVAFHPDFLPESSIETRITLQTILQEAQDLLGRKRMCMEEKRRRIRELELPEDETSLSTFQKGVRLGRHLEQLSTLQRWKLMAEFWAETILYIAPSDKVTEHIEQLAKGGEFVTHIWAMLSNAGILKRAMEDWSPMQAEPAVSNSESVREGQEPLQPEPVLSDSDMVMENNPPEPEFVVSIADIVREEQNEPQPEHVLSDAIIVRDVKDLPLHEHKISVSDIVKEEQDAPDPEPTVSGSNNE